MPNRRTTNAARGRRAGDRGECCRSDAGGDPAVARKGAGFGTLDVPRPRPRRRRVIGRSRTSAIHRSPCFCHRQQRRPAPPSSSCLVVRCGCSGGTTRGVKVAWWSKERGIAALVLKSRTLQAAPAAGGRGAAGGAPLAGRGAATTPRQEMDIRMPMPTRRPTTRPWTIARKIVAPDGAAVSR